MAFKGKRAVAVAAAMAIVTLTACTTSPDKTNPAGDVDASPPETMSASQAVQEYDQRRSQGDLVLPDGVVWREGLGPTRDENGNVIDDDPVLVGNAVGMAEMYWLCAWRWEYLTQLDKDPKRAAKALETMQAVKTMTSYLDNPAIRSTVTEELEKAALGDPTEMRNWFHGSCKHLVFKD